MIKKIGLHSLQGWDRYFDTLEKYQPPIVIILEPTKDKVNELRKRCPSSIFIGRLYREDSWCNAYLKSDPIAFAHATDQAIKDNFIPEINYWQILNEPTPYWDWLPNIDIYSYELMKLADNSITPYKVGIYAISVGNFDLPQHDPMIYWKQLTKSLKYCQDNNHVVLMHQYQKPNLINNNEDDNWLIFRLEKQVLPNLKAMELDRLKFIISEFGVDHLINNGQVGGFQKTPLSDQQYFDQLLQWEKIEQNYPQILGGCIFGFGSQNPWQSYSITENSNVINMLADHYYNNQNDYDGNKPNMTNTIFIPQIENNKSMPVVPTLEWDKRLTNRGTKYELYNPKQNEGYWKLLSGKYLDEKEHIFVDLLDENGNHLYNHEIEIYWTTGSSIIKTENKSNDPYALGDANFRMDNLGCSYNIKFKEPSDLVLCEGLGSDIEPNYKIHRSGKYIYQWIINTKKENVNSIKEVFKPRYVNVQELNVREQPSVNSEIVEKLNYGDMIKAIAKMGDWYQLATNEWVYAFYTQENKPIDLPQELPATNTEIERFKKYLARILNIDIKLLNAVLKIESGNQFWNELNKPYIRVELHLIKQCMDENTFNKYFQIRGPKQWEGHYWRKNETDAWIQAHTNQTLEYQLLDFASQFNKECVYQNTSIGLGQIMGFHYKKLGYSSAVEMFERLSESEIEQLIVFFDFLGETGALQALQENNIRKFVEIFNGSGNITHYTNLILKELDK